MLKKLIVLFMTVTVLLSTFGMAVYAADFSAVSVTPDAGMIDSGVGSITVVFNQPIDFTTADALKFTKADGSSVKGGVYVTEGDDPVQAVVSFGRLEEGSYALYAESGFAAKDGTAVTPFRYEFEVTDGEAVNTLYTASFQELTVGADYTAAQLAELFPHMTFSTAAEAIYRAEQTESGMKYLAIGSSKKDTGASARLILPEPVEKGTVYIDVKYSATADSLQRNLIRFFGIDNYRAGTFAIGKDYLFGTGGYNVCYTTGIPARDDDGFFNLRFSISREETGQNWKIYTYDMNSASKNKVGEGSADGSKLLSIESFSLTDTWHLGTADQYVYLTDFRVSVAAEQEVLYYDNYFAPDTESVKVVLAEDADPEDIDVSFVKRSSGEDVLTEIALGEDGRTILVTPTEYLEYGKYYTFQFNNGICPDIMMSTQNHRVSLHNASYGSGTIGLSVEPGDGGSHDLAVIASGYDTEGNLSGFIFQDVTVDTAETIQLDVTSFEGASTWKVFLWERVDSVFSPVCGEIVWE